MRDELEMKQIKKEEEEMREWRKTYEGVYIRNLRGGKTVKSHIGTNSKLQWPMLFMKSTYMM